MKNTGLFKVFPFVNAIGCMLECCRDDSVLCYVSFLFMDCNVEVHAIEKKMVALLLLSQSSL